MTVFARLTLPLAPIDSAVNSLNDCTVRLTPWVWWPASAPKRNRSWSLEQHVAYAGWSLVGSVVGEVVAWRLPDELQSTGTRLRNERLGGGLAAVVVWVVAAGAWDRRAEQLRRGRPWRRR